MNSGRTEEEVRLVLKDEKTASAIVFVTPEVKTSHYVRPLESPLIFERHLRKDGFVAMIVAAGGLDYHDLASVLGETSGEVDLDSWNIEKCLEDPMTENEAAKIAEFALDQRLTVLSKQLSLGESLKLEVSTRGPLGKNSGKALVADFCHRFEQRLANDQAWERHILPGLRSLKRALRKHAHSRRIECSGTLCLPAALALGVELMGPTTLKAVWTQDQHKVGRPTETWGLDTPRESSGFKKDLAPGKIDSDEVALLVTVHPHDAKKVMDDIRKSFGNSVPFRGFVKVYHEAHGPITGGEGVDIAHLANDGIQDAFAEWKVRGTVHVFMAVPAGLAFMIGQLLNGCGKIQTYEYIAEESKYVKAALLYPSST